MGEGEAPALDVDENAGFALSTEVPGGLLTGRGSFSTLLGWSVY